MAWYLLLVGADNLSACLMLTAPLQATPRSARSCISRQATAHSASLPFEATKQHAYGAFNLLCVCGYTPDAP